MVGKKKLKWLLINLFIIRNSHMLRLKDDIQLLLTIGV